VEVEIIETRDGSHTLYSPQFDEIYHSRHGAIAESQHIFIRNGLEAVDSSVINVFEVGFGTGLNAYLSMLYAANKQVRINYYSIELYPLPDELIAKINYPELLHESRDIFTMLHSAAWNEAVVLSPHLSLHKIHGSLPDLDISLQADVIFFDAFSPEKQPGMWTEAIFKKMYDILRPGGFLVTYCSKSYVRRHMEQAGFTIQKLPGPMGKRDMVRAIKKI
jgi:tRNA U34 5-methylaminomethyl-2-thiouridine-forming methyltransferase MnmC